MQAGSLQNRWGWYWPVHLHTGHRPGHRRGDGIATGQYLRRHGVPELWGILVVVCPVHVLARQGARGLHWLVPLLVGGYLYTCLAAFRSHRALQLIFLALWITFFLLAAGEWTKLGGLRMAGGYTGLLTAVLAFYLSAADVINEVYQPAVLPVGERGSTSAGVPEMLPQTVQLHAPGIGGTGAN